MCGLAGAAGATNIRTRDAFIELLLVTQLRGRDSTGIFSVGHGNNVKYVKELGPPEYLFDRKSFEQVLSGVPPIMVGHCRKKTVGDNNRASAHPFDFDNVIGVHNGTLRAYYGMEGYDHKLPDSYALYHNIDKYGAEETIRKLDPTGAWALVWWDKVNNRLNFLRNKDRPLFFAWAKDKKTMFWASETWMFGAVDRNVELWDGRDEGKEPMNPYTELPPNQLWSFTINAHPKQGEKHIHFHQPVEVVAEDRKPVGFSSTYSAGNRGGSVTNPFVGAAEAAYERFQRRQQENKDLNDDVSDLGSQAGSGSTTTASDKSKKTSSNVLDFRLGSKHSTNSERKTLSLPQKSSPDSQQKPSGDGSGGSNVSCVKESRGGTLSFPRVSVREVAGMQYITHNDTSREITVNQFDSQTGGKCCYCHKPIGDLSEVAAFTNGAMESFICTTCVTEPKVALVG